MIQSSRFDSVRSPIVRALSETIFESLRSPPKRYATIVTFARNTIGLGDVLPVCLYPYNANAVPGQRGRNGAGSVEQQGAEAERGLADSFWRQPAVHERGSLLQTSLGCVVSLQNSVGFI